MEGEVLIGFLAQIAVRGLDEAGRMKLIADIAEQTYPQNHLGHTAAGDQFRVNGRKIAIIIGTDGNAEPLIELCAKLFEQYAVDRPDAEFNSRDEREKHK